MKGYEEISSVDVFRGVVPKQMWFLSIPICVGIGPSMSLRERSIHTSCSTIAMDSGIGSLNKLLLRSIHSRLLMFAIVFGSPPINLLSCATKMFNREVRFPIRPKRTPVKEFSCIKSSWSCPLLERADEKSRFPSKLFCDKLTWFKAAFFPSVVGTWPDNWLFSKDIGWIIFINCQWKVEFVLSIDWIQDLDATVPVLDLILMESSQWGCRRRVLVKQGWWDC